MLVKLTPVGRDLEGALLLFLQVVDVSPYLLHALDERLHVRVIQVAT